MIDTAGIRETDDVVEKIGVDRAKKYLNEADLAIYVVDTSTQLDENDFEILRTILSKVKHPVIAEGNINTPEKLKRVLELGAFCAVVGSAITRPQLITKSFANAIK